MFKFTFWKIFPEGKAFIFIRVLFITVVVIVIITGGVMVVIITVGITAAVVMALKKGSGKNPEKSSPRRKWGFPLGFLMRKGV